MSDETRDRLREVVARNDPAEWLNILKHESTRANNAEEKADYLQKEVNKMRHVMQEAGTWDDFCAAYAERYGPGRP